jgi:hypothetical protein
MADTSTVGIFSLNDVRIRQAQNAWPNASPLLTVTDNGSIFNFTIDTQNQYRNQFLYYTISSVNSANAVYANNFVDSSVSGELFADSTGVIKFSKTYPTSTTRKIFTLQLRTGSITGPNILNSSNISINPVVQVLSSRKDGSSFAAAAASAKAIKDLTGTTTDGLYWIDLPTVGPQQVYCLMNTSADGGGWMMAMKATTGTTFNYSANYWTTANTLNPAYNDRTNQDAKFDVMNYFESKDIMALFPDITTNGGGLGTNPYSCWSWLQNNFNDGTRITPISFFNTAGTFNTGDVNTVGNYGGKFIGLAKSSSSWQSGVFSSQDSINFYGFNFKNPQGYSLRAYARWGFGWNENGEGNYSSPATLNSGGAAGSNDVSGGIGMDSSYGNYSAGDYIGCCQDTTGINRSARVEIYVR